MSLASSSCVKVTLHNASELPQMCAFLITLTSKQPTHRPRSLLRCSAKVLITEEYADARIAQIFYYNIERQTLSLYAFSNNNHASLIPGKNGLEISLDDGKAPIINATELENSFSKVLKEMRTGWVLSELAELKELPTIKDKDKYAYYIEKKPSLYREETLVPFIIYKLSLQDVVECITFPKLLLKIKKTALSEVISKLGLELL